MKKSMSAELESTEFKCTTDYMLIIHGLPVLFTILFTILCTVLCTVLIALGTGFV